jgi:putative ABC transport system permease protein
VQDARDRRAQIEAALALGASPRQCTAGIIRRSVRLAMVPVIDSTKTMGIVFLPGAMTGMILAGADPLQAVRLQVVVVFMLLAAVSLTATIVSRPPPAACSRRSSSCGGWGPGSR